MSIINTINFNFISHRAVNLKKIGILRPMIKAPTENVYKCMSRVPVRYASTIH